MMGAIGYEGLPGHHSGLVDADGLRLTGFEGFAQLE
jgi:hypothetical protein